MLIKETITPIHNGIEIRKQFDRIPVHLVAEWVKEAGIAWSDNEAKKDLIHKKMLSGEFDDFRVWKGKY